MKTQINLRSTFSNSTTLQRGSAALTALVLLALIGALLIYVARLARNRSRRHVSVFRHTEETTCRSFGTGSAYDGGHYVDWQPAKRVSPNLSDFGTGSVYDGGHYVDWQPTKRVSPKALDFGTGSVYDGGHYVDTPAPTLRVSPNLSKIGTGSVYNEGN